VRPVYALVRSRADGQLGPGLREVKDCAPDPLRDGLITGLVSLSCRPWNPRFVTLGADRPVVDRTGLSGLVDVRLEWSPALAAGTPDAVSASPSGAGVSLFTALQEQLGLRLEATQEPVEVLVIDRVERPRPD